MIDQLPTGVPQVPQSASTGNRERKSGPTDKGEQGGSFEDIVSKAGQQQTRQGKVEEKAGEVDRGFQVDAKERPAEMRPKVAYDLSAALRVFGSLGQGQAQTQALTQPPTQTQTQAQLKLGIKDAAKVAAKAAGRIDQGDRQTGADTAKLLEKLRVAMQQADNTDHRTQGVVDDVPLDAEEALRPSDELTLLLGLPSAKETDAKHEKKPTNTRKAEDESEDSPAGVMDRFAAKVDAAHSGQITVAADARRGDDAPASDDESSQNDVVRLVSANGRGRTVDIEVTSVPGETQRDAAKTANAAKFDTATVLEARRYLGFTPEPNATALATAIKADPTWTEALQSAQGSDLRSLGNTATEVNTLKLQMNPENLGNMVASLKLKGEELTVELRVDSVEAYQQLSADHDDIVKGLQDQGFSIDKVTVQLNATDRTDTGADRDMARQGQAQRDEQAEQRDGQGNQSGRNDGRREQPRWTPSGPTADGATGDRRSDPGQSGNIYI